MRLLLGLPARRVEDFQADCKRQGYKVHQRNVTSVASVWQPGRSRGGNSVVVFEPSTPSFLATNRTLIRCHVLKTYAASRTEGVQERSIKDSSSTGLQHLAPGFTCA